VPGDRPAASAEAIMFESWLGAISRAGFLREFYLHKPYSVAQGVSGVVSLLSWDVLWRVLPQCEASDLLAVKDGRLWRGPDPQTDVEAMDLFKAGYSLVVRHAERHDADLAKLAAEFAFDFGALVVIQLYATPRQHTSFGWHYDAEEVFIVQTVGTKRYLLRENTIRPSPLLDAIPEDMQFEKETSPVMRCDLAPGDWLYVPSGFWHVARAEEDSLSISIGVAAPTAMDLFDELRKHFAESVLWRQRLSPTGPHAEFAATLSQEAARLLRDSALVEQAIDEVRRKHALRGSATRPMSVNVCPQCSVTAGPSVDRISKSMSYSSRSARARSASGEAFT
jgi:ribosomal protein L16 Arg81 hydroxylase